MLNNLCNIIKLVNIYRLLCHWSCYSYGVENERTWKSDKTKQAANVWI